MGTPVKALSRRHRIDFLGDALQGCVRSYILFGIAVLFFILPIARAGEIEPHYYAAKPGSLAKAKARLAAGDKVLLRAFENLLSDADEALRKSPPTVTAKTKLPPSGDSHDYMSLAPYFWPDPKSKTGLPYIRHDGKLNPESRDENTNDGPRIGQMASAIETLALAYYFSGDEKYAAQAAAFARTWFLEPATRMNPHLRYAQAVLGVNEGRGTGILEGRHIAIAADAIGLLAGSKSWTTTDQNQFNGWLESYLDWLLKSPAGKQEQAAKNNHGTWYDVQAVRLALCLGRTEVARTILEQAKLSRIARQIEPDGKQPAELARTTSLSYSRFNLEALCELATLGEHAGVDLWHFQTSDGRSLRCAIEFLIPYLDSPAKKWPYQQIKEKNDQADFLSILRRASLAYDDQGFEQIITNNKVSQAKRFHLTYNK